MKNITRYFSIHLFLLLISINFSYAQKPVWNFSLLVEVSQEIVNANGGLTNVKTLVNQQLTEVNRRFNAEPKMNGITNFYAKTFQVYSDSPDNHYFVEHPNEDIQLVYLNDGSYGGDYWFSPIRTVRVKGDPSTIFTSGTDVLTHELGHSRGGLDLYAFQVNQNPINGESFSLPPSIMNIAYGVQNWDNQTIYLMNLFSPRVDFDGTDYLQQFPPSIGVRTKNNSTILSNVKINLYPVKRYSYVVQGTASITGTTNSSGQLVFPSNPFLQGEYPSDYGNFLVEAIYNGMKEYSWMPLNYVQEFKFEHPGQTYFLDINFNNILTEGIQGAVTVCQNKEVNGINYFISPVQGATYNWWVDGAANIVSGQGTNHVTVNFTPWFQDTYIRVGITKNGVYTQQNLFIDAVSCISENPVITGPVSVCQGRTTLGSYSLVPATAGATYNWWVDGAANIKSGQGTSAVQIEFTQWFNDAPVRVGVTKNGFYKEYSLFVDAKTCIARMSNNMVDEPSLISAAPNPFTDNSYIKVEGNTGDVFDMTITNAQGKIFVTKKGVPVNEDINVGEGLPSGLYFVSISKNGKIETVKIVKM